MSFFFSNCNDLTLKGKCGFCYGSGSNAQRTLDPQHAWLFRTISDYWAYESMIIVNFFFYYLLYYPRFLVPLIQLINFLIFHFLLDTVDLRCPERNLNWIWNDYKPVLGENAWANMIGPLQVALLRFGILHYFVVDQIIKVVKFISQFPRNPSKSS